MTKQATKRTTAAAPHDWTIDRIETEMDAAGSSWWCHKWMSALGTTVVDEVYSGEGGIYFVTRDRTTIYHHDRDFGYCVRKYNPDTRDIERQNDPEDCRSLSDAKSIAIELSQQPREQEEAQR